MILTIYIAFGGMNPFIYGDLKERLRAMNQAKRIFVRETGVRLRLKKKLWCSDRLCVKDESCLPAFRARLNGNSKGKYHYLLQPVDKHETEKPIGVGTYNRAGVREIVNDWKNILF